MIRPGLLRQVTALPVGLLVLVALLASSSAGAETVLRIGGTGSAMATAAALANAYASGHAGVRPRVVGNLGTGGALRALKAGALEVAISAAGLDDREAREVRSGLAALPLSRTPLVFVTHRGVRLQAITIEQAMKLYGGEQTAWPDGGRVRPILRPMSDTDCATLRAISPAFAAALARAHAIKGLQTAITDEDAIAAIAATPGAFGTTTLAMLSSHPGEVNVLSLGGVAPTQKALGDGLYKLRKTFYLVFRTPEAPEVEHFRRFIFSGRGREILMRHGQIPVSAGADPASQ